MRFIYTLLLLAVTAIKVGATHPDTSNPLQVSFGIGQNYLKYANQSYRYNSYVLGYSIGRLYNNILFNIPNLKQTTVIQYKAAQVGYYFVGQKPVRLGINLNYTLNPVWRQEVNPGQASVFSTGYQKNTGFGWGLSTQFKIHKQARISISGNFRKQLENVNFSITI